MSRRGHHPASHAARKGIKGSPHTKGMPEGYLEGHSEDHLNAHHSNVGHLSRSQEVLSRHLSGGEPHTAKDEMGGKSTSDEESEVC